MKPLPKFDKRAAITEAEEAKTWWCDDCGLATEEGQTKCASCQQYWLDVDKYEEREFMDLEPYYYVDDYTYLDADLYQFEQDETMYQQEWEQ